MIVRMGATAVGLVIGLRVGAPIGYAVQEAVTGSSLELEGLLGAGVGALVAGLLGAIAGSAIVGAVERSGSRRSRLILAGVVGFLFGGLVGAWLGQSLFEALYYPEDGDPFALTPALNPLWPLGGALVLGSAGAVLALGAQGRSLAGEPGWGRRALLEGLGLTTGFVGSFLSAEGILDGRHPWVGPLIVIPGSLLGFAAGSLLANVLRGRKRGEQAS